jgi:methylation protein EvaC
VIALKSGTRMWIAAGFTTACSFIDTDRLRTGSRFPRLPRKTNTWPEKGACSNVPNAPQQLQGKHSAIPLLKRPPRKATTMKSNHTVSYSNDLLHGATMPVQHCRACGGDLQAFMSLGYQPLAQASTTPSQTPQTILKYELKPAVCSTCGLFQVVDAPPPELLFQRTYPYFTGVSQHVAAHFCSWAESLLRHLDGVRDPLVVEIGSNDGTLLRNFSCRNIRHLGVEPAGNVAAAAIAAGLSVRQCFFNAQTAAEIKRDHGQPNIIVAANVIAHIPAIVDAANGIADLLDRDGIFAFEAIYLGDVLRNNMFDQIYAEHVFTFSIGAVQAIFRACGLELIDVTHLDAQGGSVRYSLCHSGRKPPSRSVAYALQQEACLGLHELTTYEAFAKRSYLIRDQLRDLLLELHHGNCRLAGYGASAKGTTVLNWCEIDADVLEFVSDNTPAKQGKVVPGTSIPICCPQHFAVSKPDYALLLAWNHRDEIERREIAYRQAGGKWVLYIPRVVVA